MRAPVCSGVVLVMLSVGTGTAVAQAPGAAAADEKVLRFSLSISGASVRHLDDSYRVLGDGQGEGQGAAALEASYDLRRPGAAHGLSLGLGLMGDEMGPPDGYDHVQAKVRAISYYALARLGLRRQKTVQPFVTLAAGFTRADFTITNSGGTLSGRDHGAFGRAGAGVHLAPRWLTYRNRQQQPVFGAYLSFEGGILLGTRLTFDISPEGAPSAMNGVAPIRADSVRAGDVMPTALFFGLGLGLAY